MDDSQPPSTHEEANQLRPKNERVLWFLDESFNLFADCNFAEALGGITAKGRMGGNSLVLPG